MSLNGSTRAEPSKDIITQYFQEPAPIPDLLPLTIGVLQSEIDTKTLGGPGRFKRISPEEVIMAWYAAVARDIVANKSHEVLSQWVLFMLTTEGHFQKVDSPEALEWKACQARENIKQNTTLARTTVQRIFELVQRRKEMNITSPKAMEELYSKELRVSTYSEPVTFSFIDMAFTVWDRALSFKEVQEVVLQEESLRQFSIFNSSTKLQTIVSKAKTLDQIVWSFTLLRDLHMAKLITHETCGVRWLSGTGKEAGKGYVEVMVFKKNLLSYLLETVVPSKAINADIKAKIREVCMSVGNFRQGRNNMTRKASSG